MVTTAEHLDTLSVYAPPPVTRLALQDPHQKFEGFSRRFYAATVFVDISGFTPLAEALAAAGGVRGAEELTTVLNDVFEALITTVESHGGQVVKFGGDALSLIWPSEPDRLSEAVWRAVRAAVSMKDTMSGFATVPTSQGEFELRIKIGVSVGELLEIHAGGEFSRWEYVLAGAPMANMSSAENLAAAGQIVVDEPVWRCLNGHKLGEINPASTGNHAFKMSDIESYAFGEEMSPGFYGITHLWSQFPPAPLPPPDWSQLDPVVLSKVASTLRGYIPGAISSILESGHKDMLAELKPMTVCFVGFSGIDYDNDPEAGPRLSNFMRDAQKMIYHYEGSVNKLGVGDKGSVLLVLFGAPPFFHEDDEVRGVACAMALLKVADRHNLAVRLGLTTGPLFAGPLGAPQRREYSVIGDMVNLAARLMQKAEIGQVWVDQSVQSKTERFFEFKDLGLMQVKGKTEPRHVYLALGEKDQEELVMGYLLSNQELTGRDKELEIIDALTDRIYDNQGQILLLSGEAGVGKSRFAAEIVRRWMTAGGASHGGDCVSYGRQTPYLPWRGIISSIGGLSPRLPVKERIARLERLLHRLPENILAIRRKENQPAPTPGEQEGLLLENYWLERLPLLAGMLGLETEETKLTASLSEDLRRDNIFELVRAIILQEAQQRPTLILLEDIHWSDELSMELAVYIADAIQDAPIFFILAHRPLGDPLPVSYQKIQGKFCATAMQLTELSPEAGLKLVQSKLGVKMLPPKLAELIQNKGQGNPFFIEELINSLLTMDVIKVENGECKIIGDLDKLEMPDTVQKVILARIDRLDEADKVTLKVAAAIGRTFQRDLLETVHPWVTSEHSLDEQLARLQAEDFTRQEVRESDLDFLFKHVITQEVAYETMLYSQRRHLHATIGAALEKGGGDNDGELVDLLAYHYSRSDKRSKALYYLHKAGQKALAGYANEAAVSYFTEALTVADELQDVKVQYDLLAGREQAYNRIGNRVAQGQDLKQMKQLASDNAQRQLEVGSRQLQLATNLGRYSQATQIAEETLALARTNNQPDWEARILTHLGVTSWRSGDYNKGRHFMQQALERLDVHDDKQLRATNLNYLGLIHTQFCEYDQVPKRYQEALVIYQEIGDRAGEAGCANNLGLFESGLGRYQQAEQYYNQALSICRTIGDRLREGISLNTLGQVKTILGDYEQAQEMLDRSLSIRQAIGDRRGEAFCLHDLGYLYLAQEQAGDAIQQFQAASNLRRELGETGNYVASLAALGQAHLTGGDPVRAEQCLQEAITYLQNDSGSGEYPPQNVWWVYAQVCRAHHRDDEARPALQRAYRLVKEKADRIDDDGFRHSYLNNVRVNAAIMAETASFVSDA